MNYLSVGDYLLARLHELRIKDILGVPGDFNLNLIDLVDNDLRFNWIGEANELNASYAADGYSRINGISALITTYGPGELSAINGIAGAYSEKIPIIHIVGGPAIAKKTKHLPLHHSFLNDNYAQSCQIYQHITCAATILDFSNPGAEIDRILIACYLQKQPVYLQIPQDLLDYPILAPTTKLNLDYPNIEQSYLESVVNKLVNVITQARNPVFLIGNLIIRYRLEDLVETFLHKSNYPFAISWCAKSSINEQLTNFAGLYAGVFSLDSVKDYVENSDCIISLGVTNCEMNSGSFTNKINQTQLIDIQIEHITLKQQLIFGAHLTQLLPQLFKQLSSYSATPLSHMAHYIPVNSNHDQIEHDDLISTLNQFLESGDTVLLDTGTIYFIAGYLNLAPKLKLITTTNWMSIGSALGATTGVALAKQRQGRTILLVGDGALQMSAQAISTMLAHNLNPIIIVINNFGYSVERIFVDSGKYNEIPSWSYLLLPQAFGGEAYTYSISNKQELLPCLNQARANFDKLNLIEIKMDKYKLPTALTKLQQLVHAK